MSDNAVLAAMRRLGIAKEEMSGHGFRAVAQTILDEVLEVRPDFIEHQFAHAVRDPNGRAYNRTAHLADRRAMMQQWSDYLDGLKNEPTDGPGCGRPEHNAPPAPVEALARIAPRPWLALRLGWIRSTALAFIQLLCCSSVESRIFARARLFAVLRATSRCAGPRPAGPLMPRGCHGYRP